MAGYHEVRDAAALGMYEFTTELAALEPPPPEMQAALAQVSGDPHASSAFVSMYAGTLAPAELLPSGSGVPLTAPHP